MSASAESPAARRAVSELLAAKEAGYLDEYRRLVDAVYTLAARTGTVDPKVSEIVAESGLSNQTFYRHFPSKDALLLAVLDDGRHRLVAYLAHRMEQAGDPVDAVRQFIRGVLAQAVDPDAARRSRPFAAHGDRLAARFPEAQAASIGGLRTLLSDAVEEAVAAGHMPSAATRRVDLVFWVAFDAMRRYLLADAVPTDEQVDDAVSFCLSGLAGSPSEIGA